MNKLFLFLLVAVFFAGPLYSRPPKDSTMEKTGWLIYHSDHIIWVESPLDKAVTDEHFFLQANYSNGLLVDYVNQAHLFGSIAKKYYIDVLVYDTSVKKAAYSLKDSIRILPVKVLWKARSGPISTLVEPQGLSFKRSRETTIAYKFQTNFIVSNIQLVRNQDKRLIKRVKG